MNETFKKELEQIKSSAISKIEDVIAEFEEKISRLGKIKERLNCDDKYFVIGVKDIVDLSWHNDEHDKMYLIRNKIWQNKTDAERYARIDKAYRLLVYEENEKNPIDWKNCDQAKFVLYYDHYTSKIGVDSTRSGNKGCLYCTNANIKELAIAKIGNKDLEWYLMNYRA